MSFVACAMLAGCGPHGGPGQPSASAPEIDGADLEGKPLKLSSFRGKAVVLEFWSST